MKCLVTSLKCRQAKYQKVPELATGEVTDGLFSIGGSTRTNSMDNQRGICNRQRVRIKRKMRVLNSSNKRNISHGEAMIVNDIKENSRNMELIFVKSMAKFLSSLSFRRCKGDWKSSLVSILQVAKSSSGIGPV